MRILGISAYYHDSAASIVVDGEIIAAAQEERFSRVKHDPGFPTQSIRYCLQEAGLSIDQLDAVVFYEKPFLKFERLLETYYTWAPKGLVSFLKSMPIWMREKLFLKNRIREGLAEIEVYDKKKLNLQFTEHHLSHAASAFFPSPFTEAAILTIDGVGEWTTAGIFYGDGNKIKSIREMHFPHSVGLLYSSFTYFLGFRVNWGEYKLMGLAPYGIAGSARVENYKDHIKSNLVEIFDDGSIKLNQKFFRYSTSLRMIDRKKWENLFNLKQRTPESTLLQDHCDLALAIQQVTEEIVEKMAVEALRITGSKNICLAGGVALNCVANGKLIEKDLVENLFIQPAAGDAGGALGAALASNYIFFEEDRNPLNRMTHAFLGPEFSEKEIRQTANRFDASFEYYPTIEQLIEIVAKFLNEGKSIGWFQGRMEFGPRALGNRSILADPRNPEIQRRLNLQIKKRESFRPFAPAVLATDQKDHFKIGQDSPFMLLVSPVVEEKRAKLPSGYAELEPKEKLQINRSSIPAVTHVDFSARLQTVTPERNDRFHDLLVAFKKITGLGMLVNTSFNLRGEPIVCTPDDAYRCYMNTEMDYLVIGNYLFIDKRKT